VIHRPLRFIVSKSSRFMEFDTSPGISVDMYGNHASHASEIAVITLRNVHTVARLEDAIRFREQWASLREDTLLVEDRPIPSGTTLVLACTEHQDCKEHPEIGVACFRERSKR
jgi:hypothetical protein